MTVEATSEIEAVHIISDMTFLRRLFQGIMDNAERASIASMCVFNYVCLLSFEAAKYVAKLPPGLIVETAELKSASIERSRHTVKLFDDKKKGIAGVTGMLEDEVIPGHSKEFLGNTWLPLARPLECDLGIFTYNGRIIGTTHSMQCNLGLSINDVSLSDLGPAILGVAAECSRFVDSIARAHDWHGTSFLNYVDPKRISMKDKRAARYYRSLFDRSLPLGLRASLLSFQASLNFLHEMLSADRESRSCGTVTKLKYITLRHIYTSLRRVELQYQPALNAKSRWLLNAALTPTAEAKILAVSDNRLRNVLVHYGLGKTPTGVLSRDLPLFGLVETFCPGHTFDSFSEIVDSEVQRVSLILNKWSSN